MKKTLSVALVGIVLATAAVAPAQADGNGYRGYHQGYNRGYQSNSINGWGAAAIGAVVGVALGAALLAPQPVYAAQPVVVSQPVVVVPGPTPYYVQQPICQPVQVPMYDQYGRIVQYQQMCAR